MAQSELGSPRIHRLRSVNLGVHGVWEQICCLTKRGFTWAQAASLTPEDLEIANAFQLSSVLDIIRIPAIKQWLLSSYNLGLSMAHAVRDGWEVPAQAVMTNGSTGYFILPDYPLISSADQLQEFSAQLTSIMPFQQLRVCPAHSVIHTHQDLGEASSCLIQLQPTDNHYLAQLAQGISDYPTLNQIQLGLRSNPTEGITSLLRLSN